LARHGIEWSGKEGHGKAWQGTALHVEARWGMEWQGMASFFKQGKK